MTQKFVTINFNIVIKLYGHNDSKLSLKALIFVIKLYGHSDSKFCDQIVVTKSFNICDKTILLQ